MQKFSDIDVLFGMIALIETPLEENHEPRQRMGMIIGRQIISLYIVEILLKKTHKINNVIYEQNHNIKELFEKLPPKLQEEIRITYIKLMKSHLKYTIEFCQSVDSLVDYLSKNDITDIRYSWNVDKKKKEGSFFTLLDDMMNLTYAILIVLYSYDYGPIEERYDTKILSLANVKSGNIPEGIINHTHILK